VVPNSVEASFAEPLSVEKLPGYQVQTLAKRTEMVGSRPTIPEHQHGERFTP